MGKYVPPERLAKAREMDLLTYFQIHDPEQLVKRSGEYRTVEHDSLVISNGRWHWYSRQIGGRTALDYLMAAYGLSLSEAVDRILGPGPEVPPAPRPANPQPRGNFSLPPKNPDCSRALAYLEGRGLHREILDACIRSGILYESWRYHNTIFLGRDYETGVPRYAFQRGCGTDFRGEVSGSRKEFGFRVEGRDTRSLHVFEAAIDALSYLSLVKLWGKDWQTISVLALGGVSGAKKQQLPPALAQWLRCHPETIQVILHLDNDPAGRAGTRHIQESIPPDILAIDSPPPAGKDVNDYLQQQRKEG